MNRNISVNTQDECPLVGITKFFIFLVVVTFILYVPLGDPQTMKFSDKRGEFDTICCLCDFYKLLVKALIKVSDLIQFFFHLLLDALYDAKLKFYSILGNLDRKDLCHSVCSEEWVSYRKNGITKFLLVCAMRNVMCFIGVYMLSAAVMVYSLELPKDELDKVIEDEITEKLSKDLLQSIERKFQVDLEKSVDMVLVKIKLLLQNGTAHIQDKMADLQSLLNIIRNKGESELNKCLLERQNETLALAEKALHQMVVCGYALIGHDPAQAVTRVMELKNMISDGVKPLYGKKEEIYELLKVCGHNHESLKKVIKCVISKSTIIKSVMMDVTSKLIKGVVDLIKLMAHGAMHEACLIEVVKTTEDEAFVLVSKVSQCAHGNETMDELEKFMAENNTTILDLSKPNKDDILDKSDDIQNVTDDMQNRNGNGVDKTKTIGVQSKTGDVLQRDKDVKDLKDIVRRMLAKSKGHELDKSFKKKLATLQRELKSDIDNNHIADGKKGKSRH